ncbi:MAG: alpha/beta fold hydrolase [Acidimicrobiales bacterium]
MLRVQVDGAALECRLLPEGGPHPGLRADRQPLVFLHEGLGSLTQWRSFPEQLCRRSGRAGLAFARAGHGRSQPSPPRPASHDSRTARYLHHQAMVVLPEILVRFGVPDAVLVGHSDGASIALIHAAQPAATVSGLVLLAPHVMVEDCTVAGIATAGHSYHNTDLPHRLARHHDHPDQLFRFWHDTWLSADFRHWDIRDQLGSLARPTLLIQGLDDQYGTLAQLDAIEAAVTGPTTRVELAQCGHSPHLDQPDATLDACTACLASLP